MTTLPLFQYPLTIAMLDDDPLVLNAISGLLQRDYFVKPFNHSDAALAYFRDYQPLLANTSFLRGCVEHDNYDTLNSAPVDLNLARITEIRNHPHRHQEVGVLIVDYHMPTLTGVQFCETLRDLPMKKILLTGEADHAIGVAAFNDGLIDRFVRKDHPELADVIRAHVKTLMGNYFQAATSALTSHFEVDNALPCQDKQFAEFFRAWCQANQIAEHYTLDKQGNFAVVDKAGKTVYFTVHTEKTLNEFVELYNDNQLLQPLVAAVARREKIPFFGVGKEAWEFEINEWERYLYTPILCEGRQRYYWAVVA